MEEKWDGRTELLIGRENIVKLNNAKVAVYGIGRSRIFCSRRIGKSRNREYSNDR